MTCPTPQIPITPEIENLISASASNTRKRRSLVETRSKRDVIAMHQNEDGDNFKLNSEDLQFYVGFRLDGVRLYRNMSEVLPQFGILDVYVNPEFEAFTEEVQYFRPYWPFNHDSIDIGGRRLDWGAEEIDYKVRIGEDDCREVKLYSNQIVCTPPKSRPSHGVGGSKKGAPALTVRSTIII